MENMIFSNKIISVKILTDYKINNKLFWSKFINIYESYQKISLNEGIEEEDYFLKFKVFLFLFKYIMFYFLLFSSSFEIFIFIFILHYIYIYFK